MREVTITRATDFDLLGEVETGTTGTPRLERPARPRSGRTLAVRRGDRHRPTLVHHRASDGRRVTLRTVSWLVARRVFRRERRRPEASPVAGTRASES